VSGKGGKGGLFRQIFAL